MTSGGKHGGRTSGDVIELAYHRLRELATGAVIFRYEIRTKKQPGFRCAWKPGCQIDRPVARCGPLTLLDPPLLAHDLRDDGDVHFTSLVRLPAVVDGEDVRDEEEDPQARQSTAQGDDRADAH